MTNRRCCSSIIAVALAACLAVCGATTARAATPGEPFELPVILSLTGTAAFVGKEETNSLNIIAQTVNAHGGVRGRTLRFKIEDDQSSPQVGVQLVNALVAAHAPVILGPTFTAVCAAAAPIVKDNGPVMYCYTPGIHPAPGSYVFSAMISSHDAALAMARYIRERGWKHVAFIASTDASGQDFERGFDAALSLPENRALTVLTREHFSTSDLSVTAQVARMKGTNPDAVVTWTTGTGFGTVLHAIHDVGLDVPVLGSNGNMIPSQLAQYHDFMPKTLLFPGVRGLDRNGTAAGPVRDKQRVYFDAMAKQHGDISFSSQAGWDSTLVVIDALQKLGLNANAMQIRDWIRGQHGWVGMEGVYDFSDAEQRGINYLSCVIDQFNAGTGLFTAVSAPGGAPKK